MSTNLVSFSELPASEELVMLVGWRQWADAGSISSGLPEYLIERTGARKIGVIEPTNFYLFQIPGTHHLVRPTVILEDGHQKSLEKRRNEFFFSGDESRGIVIFLGDEPHLNIDLYAEAFFEAIKTLGVKRVIGMAGVYGPAPHFRDRDIGVIYSLPHLRDELADYAVRFSDYEGGASIGSYLIGSAEEQGVEFIVYYAFVPVYDFGKSSLTNQTISIENDYKAWYDVMRRINYMLQLNIDLADLEERSNKLIAFLDDKIDDLENERPQLRPRQYVERLDLEFNENPFTPLDDVWERELRDIFDDLDE